MPAPTIDLNQLAEEDKDTAVKMLDGLRNLDEQIEEAAETVKELRAARKEHYKRLMGFVEECRQGEPPLMKAGE